MLWFILSFIVFFGTMFIAVYNSFDRDANDHVASAMIAFLATIAYYIVVFVLCILIFLGIGITDKATYKMTDSQEIICLRDNMNIEGRYYLFSGTVSEDSYYYYMYEDDFGVVQGKIKAENSYINYTDKDFRIETYTGKCNNRFVGYWLGADLIIYSKYKVYIPDGSITTENTYNIDLE